MAILELLTIDKVNSTNKVELFNRFGVSASSTDFAILTGGTANKCIYWLQNHKTGLPMKAMYVKTDGVATTSNLLEYTNRDIGIRPCISWSSIKANASVINNAIDYMEVEYGAFPKTVDTNDAAMLEANYTVDLLNKTGKSFSIYNKTLPEYEFLGKRYVRYIAEYSSREVLSNGVMPIKGEAYWILVEPISWYVDTKSNIAITKDVLLCGIPFNETSNSNTGYIGSYIAKYLDKLTDEIKSLTIEKPQVKKKVEAVKLDKTPYGLDYKTVNEEDLVKWAVLADIPVFLHGKSSDGKSARVKALDPDCEIIYLRNATPELINGKSVYNSESGEMIDIEPTWYKRICEKCKNYPDRLHILFLDEITNALHSIQGMAFNIVLNKEVNGIWKLPDNVRIVAAGNEVEDSLAANTLVEPLFNRFAHVYIKTTVKNWLEWAVKDPTPEYLPYTKIDVKAKIHPAIYSYIRTRGEGALRTQFSGKKPNADPRKWEFASKMLYVTKRAYAIRSLVGSDVAKDFVTFCKDNSLTINDIVTKNYDLDKIKKYDIAKKTSIAVSLSLVDKPNLQVIRSFLRNLEPELINVFDVMWLLNNPGNEDLLMEVDYDEFI